MYSESLYLLGAVGAFYHFRRREFIRAGAWALLVGLTRPNGALLSVPLALLAVSPWLPATLTNDPAAGDPVRRKPRIVAAGLAAAAMGGVGVMAYSLFVWQVTGHPLAWLAGHVAWGRQYQGLSHLVAGRYEFRNEGLYQYVAQQPYDLLNGLGALFVILTAWPVWRRLGLAFAVFILINIVPPLTTGGLLSAGRFSSVLFPALIWLGITLRPNHRAGWIVAFAVMQAFNAALFYTWRPLY